MKNFSYKHYSELIKQFCNRYRTYSDVLEERLQSFVLLRHDVEFSMQSAVNIASIDGKNNTKSTFFLQVKSNAYNLFSTKNQERIEHILNTGNDIGLHAYITHIKTNDYALLAYELAEQKKILEIAIGQRIKVFSYHRPPQWVLEDRQDIQQDMINAYGKSFFEYTMDPQKIKYIADSQHRFKYGDPCDQNIRKDFNRIQLLLHPDEWSEEGLDLRDNFQYLQKNHAGEFCDTIKSECNHFSIEA